MAVKRYDGSAWQTVAGLGAQGAAATSSSIATWVKTASGGETSLSGNDDNSQALSYTVGQELVFINGTLLKRGSDYTATNGTSITGLTALAANDVATVWTVNAFSVTGAIANTIVDAKGDILVGTAADTPGRLAVGTNGQVLTAASTTGTGLTWATPSSGAVKQVVTGATTSSQNITSTSYTDVTDLTVTITPSSTSSTILIIMGSEVGLSRGGSDRCQTNYQLLRGSTSLDERTYQHIGDDNEVYESNYEGIVYKDSPATTSAVTYKIQGKVVTSGETMVWASIGTIVAMELA